MQFSWEKYAGGCHRRKTGTLLTIPCIQNTPGMRLWRYIASPTCRHMRTIDRFIEIDLPVQAVYNQWTRFEDFPLFMEGVTSVRQHDHQHVEWEARIGGRKKIWQAEIFEQEPDHCIAWRSMKGVKMSGRVEFDSLGNNCTRISLHLDYEPEGILEKAASALGFVKARVCSDLLRFKEFIENAVVLPDGWRGEIHEGGVASASYNSSDLGEPRMSASGSVNSVRATAEAA
jgi:uncharacterized membrane protein